jgi:prolipoprotein diacylglyceryl transferase
MTPLLTGLQIPLSIPLSIPSPSEGVWHLGPLPLRAYALAIILGVFAAVWTGEKRWVARGGTHGQIGDLALWAVPAGLIGARLWHVATDYKLYFGEGGGDPIDALKIWQGGLGIWGAIMGGLLGAWFYCRHHGILLRPLADAIAPCLLLAQILGRFGNYFNQELFGRPTDLPWGLEIDAAHRPDGYAGADLLFHPTFLYEALWNLAAIGVLLWADRRFRLGYGRVFALYVMLYTLGRGWIENLRIDPVELQDVGGLRFNVWTSIVLFVLAAAYFVVMTRRHPRPDSREPAPYVTQEAVAGPETDPETGAGNGREISTERGAEGASVRSEGSDTADLSGPDAPGDSESPRG